MKKNLLYILRNFSTASYLQDKLKRTQKLALEHHVEYLRSLRHPNEIQKPSIQTIYKADDIRSSFIFPDRQKQFTEPCKSNVFSSENKEPNKDELLLSLSNSQYKGELRSLSFEYFGDIKVIHDDIFVQSSDCILIPMTPNLMPFKGLGLETLERGGEKFIREVFISAKQKIGERIRNLQSIKEKIIKEGEAGKEMYDRMLRESQHLMLGDVILAPSEGICNQTSLIAFVVMPYFWQGGITDAARRLRYSFKTALNYLNKLPLSKICLPNLSNGICGYQPSLSSNILMEETLDILMQVEEENPRYMINEVHFVDSNEDTAQILKCALETLGRAYIPSLQVVPAPVYWSQKNRRLLEISPQIVKFCKKHQKFSFKKYHSIIRRRNEHWFSNLRPYVWRTSRCLEPPPLFLMKETGEVAEDYQLSPRPFYYRGVSHFLFPPKNKLNFISQRVNRSGKLVGVNKMPNISTQVKPKL